MIAIHVADEALKAGFRVRGTVRSKQKGEEAAKLLNSPDFEVAIVPDMAADGCVRQRNEGRISCHSLRFYSLIFRHP